MYIFPIRRILSLFEMGVLSERNYTANHARESLGDIIAVTPVIVHLGSRGRPFSFALLSIR